MGKLAKQIFQLCTEDCGVYFEPFFGEKNLICHQILVIKIPLRIPSGGNS